VGLADLLLTLAAAMIMAAMTALLQLSSAMDTAIASALANIDTALLADISTPMMSGDFVNPTTGFGMMQDIPGPAMQSAIDAAQLATPGLYGSKATTGDSFAGLLGDSPESSFGFYETIPVPRGSESNVFDPLVQQGINMRQAEFDALSARYDGLAPLATFNIVPELNTQLEDLNSQLAGKQDEILGLQTRLDDTFKQFTDLQGQYGTQSDQLTALDEQFGLSQQQIQDQAARIAQQEEDARRNRILGIAGVAPVASSAMTQDDVYNLFGGPGPRTAALGSGPSADEVVRAMNFEGEVVPGFGASIDRAIGDFMGETYGGRTEQLPDGTIR
jgi:hypothetical protein